MTSDVKEWDEEATAEVPPPAPGAAAEPTLFFGSVDEFVRERLRYTYTRRVGPQGPNRVVGRVVEVPGGDQSSRRALALVGGAAPGANVRNERLVA